MKSTEYHVNFDIINFDCSPDEITSQLGVSPSDVWLKGEYRFIKEAKIPVHENTWELKSEMDIKTDIGLQIENLLNKLKSESNVKSIANKFETLFYCAIYFYDYNASFDILPEIHNRLGMLGIKLRVDLYCLKS